MDDRTVNEIMRGIFVGREQDIENLHALWEWACDKSSFPRYAYALLNAPGIGKTSLLDHFGKMLMDKKLGIYIKVTASEDDRNNHLYTANWMRSFNEHLLSTGLP